MRHNMVMPKENITIAGFDVPYNATTDREFELEASDILSIPIWEVYDAFCRLMEWATESTAISLYINTPEEDTALVTDCAEKDGRISLEALCGDGRVSSDEEFIELLDATLWKIRTK